MNESSNSNKTSLGLTTAGNLSTAEAVAAPIASSVISAHAIMGPDGAHPFLSRMD